MLFIMKKMPIDHMHVTVKTVENLLSTNEKVFKPSSKLRHQDFQRHEYIGTDYDKVKNIQRVNREQKKIFLDSFSKKPFKVSSRMRAKTEDIFFDPDYAYPRLGPGGQNVKAESLTRSDILGNRSLNFITSFIFTT